MQTLRDLKALEDARLDAEAIRDEALYTAARIEENMDATISLAWSVYLCILKSIYIYIYTTTIYILLLCILLYIYYYYVFYYIYTTTDDDKCHN